MKKKKLIFCVINDLTYDQRMIRICSTLAQAGFDCLLVGRKLRDSRKLDVMPFQQKRLNCWFAKGPAFYAEYNIRLFFFLVFQSVDVLTACDLDTALAVRWVSRLRRKSSVYDAHEFFTEVPEVMNRKRVKRVWEQIGNATVKHFDVRYTVNQPLAEQLTLKYDVPFEVIRNVPMLVDGETQSADSKEIPEKILVYQGALNVGRGLEQSIKAMQYIEDVSLWLIGDGDICQELEVLVDHLNLTDRVLFKGKMKPVALKELTPKAFLGLNLLEGESLNYYYSLANKFFDYMHAGVPSLNMAFPAYQSIMKEYQVGILLEDLDPKNIAAAVNRLLENPALYASMKSECARARVKYQWREEAKKLIDMYNQFL